jgi:NADPH-dependent ferric siderophore reductase
MTRHEHQRIRHNVVFRSLHVKSVERLTTHMQRIVFDGESLRGFVSAAPGDHVKLFFPNRDGEMVTPTMGANGPEYPPGREPSPMRDYTPRAFDAERNELTVDFVLHGEGPAASWAAQAKPGQRISAGGPRGSFMVANDFDTYVLIGDETALPAIGRWLEEMPTTTKAEVLLEIPDVSDRQALPSGANVAIHWYERQGLAAENSELLERALRDLVTPQGDTFYWIATESHRARAMRQFLTHERGIPKEHMKASGYWVYGEDIDDDA